MSDRYAWRIRVDYRDGQSLVWPCSDEAAARAELAIRRDSIESGRHPYIVRVRLERRPIEAAWEMVES